MSALLALMAWAAAGAAPVGEGFGLPLDYSSEGWRIDRTLDLTHLFVGALIIVAFAWMLWAVFVGRRREQSEYSSGESRREKALPLALAAFVFFVVDGQLFVNSTVDTASVFSDFARIEGESDVLRLQINGRQWAWDARYPGGDNRFGTDDDIYVTTELRIPLGRPVIVEVASVDVVHALHIPNLRVQVDAIPGRISRVWFQAERKGLLDVVCTQYCGVSHYRMAGTLRVLEGAEFDRWVESESRYSEKIAAAASELETVQQDPLFPSFAREPNIPPRGWGWPWAGGAP